MGDTKADRKELRDEAWHLQTTKVRACMREYPVVPAGRPPSEVTCDTFASVTLLILILCHLALYGDFLGWRMRPPLRNHYGLHEQLRVSAAATRPTVSFDR